VNHDYEVKYQELYQKGLEEFRKNSLTDAIRHWKEASAIDLQKPDIHSILGSAYKLLNDIESSSRELEKAAVLEPGNFKYLYEYGLILNDQKRYQEALHVLRKALDLQPGDFELINDIGVVCFNLGNYSEAENYLKEALEINEKYLAAGVNLCHVYFELDELVSAENIINNLRKYHADNSSIVELQNLLSTMLTHPEKQSENKTVNLEFSEKIIRIKPLEILENFSSIIDKEKIELSIVIPIMNEKDNIPILYDKLKTVLNNLRQNYEIIWIDDGSYDGSYEILLKLTKQDSHVKVIQFRKNYGQTAAISAGFKYSHGSVIITMDGDLQNDPEDIPLLLEKMAEGYDLVSGWRKNRQDNSLTRNLPSYLANRIINKLIEGTRVQLHDFGCTLKAYKRGIVKNIHLYGEMHRFIPAFAGWIGVKVAEIPVRHHPRIHGHAKYNLSRIWRVLFDLLVVRFFTDFMTRPIQFFGRIARKMFGWGTLLILLMTLLKALFNIIPFSYDTFLILFGILSVTSFQLVVMGLLGEIMMRIYFEGQKKDAYIVEKIVGGR